MVPVAYNIRNLMVRKTTTAATAVGIGMVVFVFASVMMLGEGLRRAMARSGSPDVAIVMRSGSDAELSSGIELPAAGLVMASPEVATRPDGHPDAVGEVVVQRVAERCRPPPQWVRLQRVVDGHAVFPR